MSNPMVTLQECIEEVSHTRASLNRAKMDHEGALRDAIRAIMNNPGLIEHYLLRNPAATEAILRLAAK